ncbi:MAG: NAD-dependent epimerase/dehydratase family protein [bacterium]
MEVSGKNKVVVTGGAGFIGSNLVEALLSLNYDVHVIDNLVAGKKENVPAKATLHVADICNLAEIKPIFAGAKYVFHLAALPRVQHSIDDPVATNEVNVTGTINVLLAARDAGVKKVVYSASSAAYGDQTVMPLKENMLPNPKSPYGIQKLVGEYYCKFFSEAFSLPTVSLRYFNVYGPKLDPNGAYALVIGLFLRQRQEGKPMTITGDGLQTRDFTHVRDVARANILAAESEKVGKGEVINIGVGKNHSIKQLAELIGGPIEHVAPRIEPRDTLADNSLARELIGWEPQEDFAKGISELKSIFQI